MVVYNSRLTSPGDPERSRHFGYEAPCIRSIAPKQVQASSRTLDERHPCDVTETTSARVRAVNPPRHSVLFTVPGWQGAQCGYHSHWLSFVDVSAAEILGDSAPALATADLNVDESWPFVVRNLCSFDETYHQGTRWSRETPAPSRPAFPRNLRFSSG